MVRVIEQVSYVLQINLVLLPQSKQNTKYDKNSKLWDVKTFDCLCS